MKKYIQVFEKSKKAMTKSNANMYALLNRHACSYTTIN